MDHDARIGYMLSLSSEQMELIYAKGEKLSCWLQWLQLTREDSQPFSYSLTAVQQPFFHPVQV